MPYVMKHSITGTLLASVQRNGYKLAYYGIMNWEEPPTVEQMAEALAEAGVEPGDPAGKIEDWESLSLNEHEMKMANVKLRNDPRRVVYYRNGILAAKDA
ncbi:hypothetical protein D7Z26_02540 [Cohnella endophytica]|uniref:Uncharacterized protein n=1 Tax=Cohnella endophytica TaxID=2419778 RepID=A0A494Y2A9_9BACL|nr:hypothetical protein [Cohnella endophytica]RKP56886.1 hypothetical protein D7Z26_02540 [Cohnella endophytica]